MVIYFPRKQQRPSFHHNSRFFTRTTSTTRRIRGLPIPLWIKNFFANWVSPSSNAGQKTGDTPGTAHSEHQLPSARPSHTINPRSRIARPINRYSQAKRYPTRIYNAKGKLLRRSTLLRRLSDSHQPRRAPVDCNYLEEVHAAAHRRQVRDLDAALEHVLDRNHLDEQDDILLRELAVLDNDRVFRTELLASRQAMERAELETQQRAEEDRRREAAIKKRQQEEEMLKKFMNEEELRRRELAQQAKEQRRREQARQIKDMQAQRVKDIEAQLKRARSRNRLALTPSKLKFADITSERVPRVVAQAGVECRPTARVLREKRRREREERRRKEEEERGRKEREERDRKEKEDRDRKEKEERDRKEKEERDRREKAEREHREREERERKEREAADKLQAELRRREEELRKEALRQAEAARLETEQRALAAQIQQQFVVYDGKWAQLKARAELPLLTAQDLPWPVLWHPGTTTHSPVERVREFVFHPLRPGMEGKSPRERLMMELLRWHTDKFDAIVLPTIHPEHREFVAEQAQELAKILSLLKEEISG
jgi:hypothetical protein